MSAWLEAICGIVMNGITLITIFLMQQMFFGVKKCPKWWHYLVLLGGVMVYNVLLVLIFPEGEQWQFILLMLFTVVVGIAGAEQQRWRCGLEGIVACLLYGWCAFLAEMIGKLLGLDIYGVKVDGEIQTIVEWVLYVILLGILFVVQLKTVKKHISLRLTVGEELIWLGLTILSPIFSIGLDYIQENMESRLYSLAWVVFVLSLNIGIFSGIMYRKLAHYYRSVSENYRKSLDSEYRYFKDYKESQTELLQFKHDWKNHMLTIQGLLEQGAYADAQAYFHTLSEMSGFSDRILTGNEIVDILLNAKSELMRELGIRLDIQGSLASLTGLEKADCSILFSNLIDNAMEANEKCPKEERYIQLRAVEMPGILMIAVENPMEGQLHWEGEQLLSSKVDNRSHGIGTKNIRRIIEKYHGEYQVQVKQNQFTMQMILPRESALSGTKATVEHQ